MFYLACWSVVKLALAMNTVVFSPTFWQFTVAANAWKDGVSTAAELMSQSFLQIDDTLYDSGTKRPAPDLQLSELCGFSPHVIVVMQSCALQASELGHYLWRIGAYFRRFLNK